MAGFARVGFAAKGGTTRLSELDQRSPLRVLFPRAGNNEPPHAAVTTVSGGLVGGDTMRIEVAIGPGAKAVAIGQAAEKIYRSAGPDSRVDIVLDVAAGGWLEWLPQETILFDGARLDRRTRIDIEPEGRAMAGECIVFGRLARDEVMRRGLVRDRWEVRCGGRLVWADSLAVDNDILAVLDAPSGFAGARACATAVYVGPDAASHLEAAKELAAGDDGVRAGATLVNGVLVARWLSADPMALRRAFADWWIAMRKRAGGLPENLPRLWYV